MPSLLQGESHETTITFRFHVTVPAPASCATPCGMHVDKRHTGFVYNIRDMSLASVSSTRLPVIGRHAGTASGEASAALGLLSFGGGLPVENKSCLSTQPGIPEHVAKLHLINSICHTYLHCP